MNEPPLTVHDLAPNHVVVEVHEALTEPFGGLELHLTLPIDRLRPVAWWMDEWGRLLRKVPVGEG